MRDPERITRILSKLAAVWSMKNYYDLRLGQLLINLSHKFNTDIDIFYVEDDDIEKILDKFLQDEFLIGGSK